MRLNLNLLLFYLLRQRLRNDDEDGSEGLSTNSNIDININVDDGVIFALLYRRKAFHIPSRNQKSFYKTLHLFERRLRRRSIPRDSLQPPHRSSFRKLYESGNDGALITLTGLDHATFRELSVKFKLYFDVFTPHTLNGKVCTEEER